MHAGPRPHKPLRGGIDVELVVGVPDFEGRGAGAEAVHRLGDPPAVKRRGWCKAGAGTKWGE
jgi:hypothetical protein